MGSFKYLLIFLLFLISLVSSFVLAFPSENVYNFEGCASVFDSEQINFSNLNYIGIGISLFGVVFSFLAFKKITSSNRALVSLLIFAEFIFSLYLVYNLYFLQTTSCFYVNILGISSLLLLLILIFSRRRYSRVRRKR